MHAAPLSFFTARLPHWRLAASAAAAALALTFLVGTPRGQAMAAQFLAQFRSERLAVVTVDPRNAGNLEALNHLGTVTGGVGQARQPQTVSTVAEASQRVGFQVRQPDPKTLPTGLNPTPTIRVTTATQLRFTFDRAKALAYFQSIGRSDVSVPAKFDQATLVVSIPAAALLQYQSQTPARTVPAPAATAEASRGRQPSADQVNAANTSLLIGESGDLVVGTEGGVSLDEFRELLLGLPGLPRETVDQLRAIQDWRTTLPIPVPVDQVSWKATTVNGAQGIALTGNSGLGSGVIWQQDGHIYGVAGFATDAEVQGVANALAR